MAATSNLGEALQRAIQSEVNRVAEEEIKAATARIEERVRKNVVQIAAVVVKRLSMETFGNELVIRLQFDDLRK